MTHTCSWCLKQFESGTDVPCRRFPGDRYCFDASGASFPDKRRRPATLRVPRPDPLGGPT